MACDAAHWSESGVAAVVVPVFRESLVASNIANVSGKRRVTFSKHIDTCEHEIDAGCVLFPYFEKPQRAIALQKSGKYHCPLPDPKISRKNTRLAILRALRLHDLLHRRSGHSLSARGGPGPQKWILDSGSRFDIIGTQSLSEGDKVRIRKDGKGVLMQTANGVVSEPRKLDINVDRLHKSTEAVVRDRCPNVLSLGHRCLIHGYSFNWKAYEPPTLTHPDGRVVVLDLEWLVPVLPFFPAALPVPDGAPRSPLLIRRHQLRNLCKGGPMPMKSKSSCMS